MKHLKFIFIGLLLISHANGQTQDVNGMEKANKAEIENKLKLDLRVSSGSGPYIWGGMQLRLLLIKHFELAGSADIMLFDQLLDDQLIQGNFAYNIKNGRMIAFVIGGIGFHNCNESSASTPMTNFGAGIQTNSKPAIRFEYRAHIKYNKQGPWNITHDNLHLVSLGISLF